MCHTQWLISYKTTTYKTTALELQQVPRRNDIITRHINRLGTFSKKTVVVRHQYTSLTSRIQTPLQDQGIVPREQEAKQKIPPQPTPLNQIDQPSRMTYRPPAALSVLIRLGHLNLLLLPLLLLEALVQKKDDSKQDEGDDNTDYNAGDGTALNLGAFLLARLDLSCDKLGNVCNYAMTY